MYYPISTRETFKPDSDTTVYLPPVDAGNMSATVFIALDGFHGSFVNRLSRKDYLIASGNIKFTTDGKEFETVAGDIISVPIQTKHAMEGQGSFFLTTTPPFDPATEEQI